MAVFATTDQLLGAGMLLTTIILASLTAWYTWSTHRYVRLTRKLLQSQTDPCVIAYTQVTPEYRIVEIVVENIGRGIAWDVRLDHSEKVQELVWSEFSKGSACSSAFFELLKDGIRVLPPGRKVVIRWNRIDAIGLLCADGLPILCKYKRPGRGPETEVEPVECYLEVASHVDRKTE